MDIAVEIGGNLREGIRFESEIPDEIRDSLTATITELTEQLYGSVEARVPRRTGKLASEVRKYVNETEYRITGRVTIVTNGDRNELLKAIAEEYGAHAYGVVKPHHQRISTVFGRLVAPLDVTMRSYDRLVNIQARAYERSPLDAMRGEIAERLEHAVTVATENA